ncbi:MAG: tyrosine-type recombinase/integrase [Candidatus Tectimicrobiota bacterium]
MASITKRIARGKVVYGVRVRRKGQSLLTATFERLTDARQWAQRMEGAVSENRAAPGNAARKNTVADLIKRYRETVMPQKRPSTAVNQLHHLAWWQERIGHLLLIDVTPAAIVEHRDLLAKQHSPGTTNRYMSTLSHAFHVAMQEWQWLDDTPFRRVSKPREPRGRVRFLSDDERTRLLAECRASQNPHLYVIVVLALSTGGRKGELLGLRWPDVDLQRGQLTFRDTKNRDTRSVPLAGPALTLMRAHAKVRRLDTDLVFSRCDGRGAIEIKKAWENAVKRARLDDFHFHDLRHSAASYLAMSGASPVEIADVLGHRSLSMVQRYAHLSEAHTAGVVARMNAAIFGGA